MVLSLPEGTKAWAMGMFTSTRPPAGMEAVVLHPVLGLVTVTLHARSAERIKQICVGSELLLLINENQKSVPCVEAVCA